MINNFDILAIMEMEEPTKFGNIGKSKGMNVRITEKYEKNLRPVKKGCLYFDPLEIMPGRTLGIFNMTTVPLLGPMS